jgi:hypothetical protein
MMVIVVGWCLVMQGLLKQRALSSVVLSVVAAVFSLSSLMMPHRCLLLMSDVGLMSFGFVVVVVVFRSVPSSLTIFGRLALVYDFDCLWMVTLEASCRCCSGVLAVKMGLLLSYGLGGGVACWRQGLQELFNIDAGTLTPLFWLPLMFPLLWQWADVDVCRIAKGLERQCRCRCRRCWRCRWCWCVRAVLLERLTFAGRTLELKTSLVDGRLGCVRLVMSLKLLLKLACHLLVVRSADVAAAGCVVALGAKLLSPLSFSVSLIVEADEVRRICHYYHGYNVGRAVSCTVALRLVSSSSLD